eukprot:gene2013-2290_t
MAYEKKRKDEWRKNTQTDSNEPNETFVGVTTFDEQRRRYLNQEFGESNVDSQKTMSVEDGRALTVFKDSIQLHDGHYNVSIPWKRNPPDLPNNRRLAQKRMEYLKIRLQKDPSLKQKYTSEVGYGVVTYLRSVNKTDD